MAKASLSEIVRYCDRTLRIKEIADSDRAFNGLQVENDGTVARIAASVDASLATVRLAIAAKADLLIVHHGLFWTPKHPWVGPHHKLLQLLIENNLAIYSCHLPLDIHPRLGNNALLCAALGLKNLRPFYFHKGPALGLQTTQKISRAALAKKLQIAVGTTPIILPGGPEMCQKIGVVTGGAGDGLKLAASEGVDTFITGEGQHWTHGLAEEYGINVLYGGHYATETFGVKALAADLAHRYKLPWSFLDHPSGL